MNSSVTHNSAVVGGTTADASTTSFVFPLPSFNLNPEGDETGMELSSTMPPATRNTDQSATNQSDRHNHHGAPIHPPALGKVAGTKTRDTETSGLLSPAGSAATIASHPTLGSLSTPEHSSKDTNASFSLGLRSKLQSMRSQLDFDAFFNDLEQPKQREVISFLFNDFMKKSNAHHDHYALNRSTASRHAHTGSCSTTSLSRGGAITSPTSNISRQSVNNTAHPGGTNPSSGSGGTQHTTNTPHGAQLELPMFSRSMRSQSISGANTSKSHSLLSIPCNERHHSESVDEHGYEVLNGYTIIDQIGSGTSGVVMLALQTTTQEPFAIKAVGKTSKLKFGRALPTFDIEREVAVMKKLHHPNIVQLHEVIDDPEERTMFLVLDYIPNGPILKMHQEIPSPRILHPVSPNSPTSPTSPLESGSVRCDPLPDEKLISYAKQIAEGLRYLHKRNVIHRDIKPDNILLGDEDQVYIADFGLSDVVAPTYRPLMPASKRMHTNTGGNSPQDASSSYLGAPATLEPPSPLSPVAAKGTPYFLSPEACQGEPQTAASDVWSFGVLLYLAKFGVLPFPGFDGSSMPSICKDILESDLKFPAGADPLWRDCLSRLLRKDPQRRMTLKAFLRHKIFSPRDEPSKDDLDSAGGILLQVPSATPQGNLLLSPNDILMSPAIDNQSFTLHSPQILNLDESGSPSPPSDRSAIALRAPERVTFFSRRLAEAIEDKADELLKSRNTMY